MFVGGDLPYCPWIVRTQDGADTILPTHHTQRYGNLSAIGRFCRDVMQGVKDHCVVLRSKSGKAPRKKLFDMLRFTPFNHVIGRAELSLQRRSHSHT